MDIKESLLKYIKEGKYQGPTEAARDLHCSATAVWYALRALEAEGAISSQSKYKAN
jgi:DNA-binding Lrp family transcriptional regulator